MIEAVKYSYEQALAATMEYFDGDKMCADVWCSKYALKDSEGNLYELTPRDMHRRIARELARIEGKYENPMSEDEIFELLDEFRYVVPQGSPMAGIGNNRQTVSLSNCFVVDHDHGDSYGAIMKVDEETIQLMKRRGGVGNDLSSIRPAGAPVANAAITSTGVVPFMERYSNSTREVAQGGRRGARMLTISIKHPEAEAFIDAKLDTSKITGANISVKIDDEFMDAVVNDSEYEQQWPVDSKNPSIRKTIRARALWEKLVYNNWKSAEPGILFWSRMISQSLPDCYADLGFKTVSTNPCGEIALPDADSCRLLVVNLFGHVKDPFTSSAKMDWKQFDRSVTAAQRMMDDIIDLELEKIDGILAKIESDPEPDYIKRTERELWLRMREKCEQGRRTGLGPTGEGDMIAALGLRYGTPEATDFSEKVHRRMCLTAFRSSVVLARERGAFPLFDYRREEANPYMQRIAKADPKLYEDMKQYGRRNIALLTCAPSGTVSVLTQTSSGIEPVFMVAYTRRRKINPDDKSAKVDFVDAIGDSWEEYSVFHRGFALWLAANGHDIEQVSRMAPADLHKLIEVSPYYKSMANDVDWVESVRLQGRVQRWICHSISKTTNLPNSVGLSLVNDVYMEAWRSGCKGCTVYRDGSRTGVLIEKKQEEEKLLYKENHAPKRPKVVECDVHRFTNKGERWIGLVGTQDGRPYEVFTGPAEEFKIPTYVELGNITKSKTDEGSKYDFVYVDRDGVEHTVEWLNRTFNKEYWNYAKMLSGVLRHGMPLPYVVDLIGSLNLDDDVLTTWKAGIARMIKKYIPDGTAASDKKCKECGSESVVYQEGCLSCKNCGSSKCG